MSDAPAVEPRTEAAFVELLRAAATSADGVAALASAYAALSSEERARLLDAIDAAAVEPSIAFHDLAAALSVESDVELAARIAERMRARTDAVAAPASPALRAYLAGDETDGALVLVRSLHGAFVEALALAWSGRDGAWSSSYVPVLHDDDVASFVQTWSARAPAGRPLARAAPRDGMDLLAAVVWARQRATGTLPHGVDRFADLLVP